MADNYGNVFHVRNFSTNNNLRIKYTMPSTSRIGSHYSKALSVMPYTSSLEPSSVSLKSPLSPSSSHSPRSTSGILTRHYTSPLPSLSVSTTDALLLKTSLISPGSARAVKYSRSNSAAVVGSSFDAQRGISSGSYKPLSVGTGSSPLSPTSPGSLSSGSSTFPTTSQRTPLMFPIVSKSLLRYRHTFSRPSVSIPRRCGSVDPDIYRRISLNSRQISTYSVSSSTNTALEIRGSSRSRSHSASCSNSRSSSMDRYVNRNNGSGINGNGLLLGSSTSGSGGAGGRSSDSRKTYSRESSYSAVGNGDCFDSETYIANRRSRENSCSVANPENLLATASDERKILPSCVTELARNVASHQWETDEKGYRKENDQTVFNRQRSPENVNGNISNKTINGYEDNDDNGNNDSGIQGRSSLSRQSSIMSSCTSTDKTEFDSCSTATMVPPPPPPPPFPEPSTPSYKYDEPGSCRHNSSDAAATTRDSVERLREPHPLNDPIQTGNPSITRTKIAQSTTTATDKRITTTTTSTDIIDMKFMNGFVHLVSNGSMDRISSPSKSTRQRMRLAKLQNKYGAFKSWLTPEDEKTLARVSIAPQFS